MFKKLCLFLSHSVAAPEILFRKSLKNFNKKKLEYIELSTKKKNLIYEVLQFSSTSFQIFKLLYDSSL